VADKLYFKHNIIDFYKDEAKYELTYKYRK